MSHFALVNAQGIVEQVIVAEQDVIDTGAFGPKGSWVQTSYNTYGGQHPEGRPLRKNYAGIGYTYDAQRDAFIPPKPSDSATLNEETCLWEVPVDETTITLEPEVAQSEVVVVSEVPAAQPVIDIVTTEPTITLDTASATPTV